MPNPVNWMKLGIGGLADHLGKLREDRLKLQAAADKIKETETSIKSVLMDRMTEQKLDKAGGKRYGVTLKQVQVPEVQDWEKLYGYMVANNAMDLLQRRPSLEAFRLRWEAGESVNGVRAIEKQDLSLNARRG